MGKIKQLSQHEAQKIAAGEVVERPANIVKELIENSIDAGATRISLYIEDAGKQLIRVVDNGCGMDITDAQQCFDRHATSKITHVDELETINTFGFRGEALASIASVSQITLITKEEQSLEGIRVDIQANTIAHVSATACPTGTDMCVKNLFFNVPARKKFLKSTQTEWRAIQLLFNAFCFDYPHIHFSLYCDNKQVHNCPATQSLKDRALQLWNTPVHQHLIPIHTHNDKTCSIQGIISDHQQYRYDRSSIYFFVNKRWIKNQSLTSALIKGYANVIPEGRCPLAVINITLPSHEVDINIHPRKEEVKFLHPKRIEQALQEAVKGALEKNISQHIKKDVVFKSAPTSFTPLNFNTFFEHQKPSFFGQQTDTSLNGSYPSTSSGRTGGELNNTSDFIKTLSDKSLNSAVNAALSTIPIRPELVEGYEHLINFPQESTHEHYRLIGQYNKTYLLIEKENGLFLIDQHAAHERILYELFAHRFSEVATVHLLFPHIITLSEHEIELITPHLSLLVSNGITIEQYGHNQLIIQSLPVHLKEQPIIDLIKDMIQWIAENKSIKSEELTTILTHKLHTQMACKAAVKAGDELSHEKMQQLLTDLEKTANRFSCPHGRPTGWLLSLSEIEKKFKRDYK